MELIGFASTAVPETPKVVEVGIEKQVDIVAVDLEWIKFSQGDLASDSRVLESSVSNLEGLRYPAS